MNNFGCLKICNADMIYYGIYNSKVTLYHTISHYNMPFYLTYCCMKLL